MNDHDDVSIPELLSQLDAGWAELQAFIASLTPEQLTVPTDAAGWTVKDHLIHLAVWEDGMNAVLTHQSRRERMGIPAELWGGDDYDGMNAIIQQKHHADTLDSVLATLDRVHAELRSRIAALSTTDLLAPYSDYQPDSTSTNPIVGSLAGNSFGHYEEHIPWMQAIVEQD
ncbi:MAG: ClbS/DfsB family four-helix bundle protein [Anaerolineae bacterium]|nr:ClbS/DfsB family four-helix bundle protein [Anaerolineae bacterium]